MRGLGQKYKNLQDLEKLNKGEGVQIQKIFLLSQLLNSLNDQGLRLLDENMDTFQDKVWKQLPENDVLQGFTWQRVLMSFSWNLTKTAKLLKLLSDY